MTNNKKTAAIISLMAVITSILVIFGISASAATVTPTEARNSVVTVVRADGYAQGSGFAIGKVGKPVEFIVTNNHVVRGEWNNTTAVVYFSMASDEKMLANVYFYDAEKDIAILRLPEPTDKRRALSLCPMKYVDLNDTFAALGYPGNQETDWPKYSVDDITITKGGIKKLDRVSGQDVYMLDLAITHGNSGGPLINKNGEVVGINTFGINNDNYAIVIDELLDIINTDKIPVTVHKSRLIFYGIIGGSSLLAILLLIAALAFMNSKKVKVEPVAPPPSGPVNYTHPQQTPAAPVNSVRIIAIGGTLNGKKYSSSGSIKIGRDAAKCGIAFPVNTQGVSGVHCEIVFDGSACYLKDLHSSYGTFLMNGTKLAPNAPVVLQPGDKFYLASPENTFEVRF